MRESQIFDMNQRRAENEVKLYKMATFCNMRMESFETVLKSSTLRDRLSWLINPSKLIKRVNTAHLEAMKAHDEAARKSAAEVKAKPKLTLVGANGIKPLAAIVLALFLSSGCVTKAKYHRDVLTAHAKGYEAADKECIGLQRKLMSYLGDLQERLKRFNQLDSSGNLYPLKKPEGEVMGREEWQK